MQQCRYAAALYKNRHAISSFMSINAVYTVKNIRISTDVLWRIFHILTQPVPYPLFRRFADTNVYETGSVKIRKTRHKMSANVDIFTVCGQLSEMPANLFLSVLSTKKTFLYIRVVSTPLLLLLLLLAGSKRRRHELRARAKL